jgi:hypothetical protein
MPLGLGATSCAIACLCVHIDSDALRTYGCIMGEPSCIKRVNSEALALVHLTGMLKTCTQIWRGGTAYNGQYSLEADAKARA